MNKALPFLILGLVALAGCNDRREATPPASGDKVNANATVDPPPTGTPASRADAEDPATGTNSRRPDSPRDLKPGTDGNTPPVR